MKKQTLLLCLILCGIYSYSQQWTFLGFPDEKINAIAIHPQNPDILFVSGDYLYKSSDGGINWDTVAFYSFNSIIFHPMPDTMYATFGVGSYSDGIYKSIDGGNNWNDLKCLYFPTSLTIPGYPQGTIVAGTKGTGVYESNDYGDTWNTISDSLDNLNVLTLTHINPCDCDSNQVYFAGTEGGIFYFNYDLHDYWHNTNIPTNASVPAISTDGICYLWAAIDGGSYSDGMYKSNYGINWNVTEYWPFITDILINPLNLDSLYAPNTVYAANSGYGVKKTINGGISWTTINTGLGDSTVYCLAQSPADTTLLYAGTSSGVYVLGFSNEVTETLNKNHINIYPNPANENIIIEGLQTGKIEIMDINGKFIKNVNVSKTMTSIDISKLSSGVYSIKIITDDGIIIKKLVKK